MVLEKQSAGTGSTTGAVKLFGEFRKHSDCAPAPWPIRDRHAGLMHSGPLCNLAAS